MKTEKYTMLTGETIEYERPTEEVASFLARVRSAANNPHISESEMVDLIYGRENPILDQTLFPYRGAVTKEVFANPLYHVMLDLLDHKRVQVGSLDVEKAKAEYTLRVPEVAERLGIHQTAVRYAIKAKKLAAIKQGGTWLISPDSVESYKVSKRGPAGKQLREENPPTIEAKVGSAPGLSLRIMSDPPFVPEEQGECWIKGSAIKGTLRNFVKAFAIMGRKQQYRFFVLEPSDEENELALGPLYIRGQFSIVEKINNSRKATERWRALKGEPSEEKAGDEDREHPPL